MSKDVKVFIGILEEILEETIQDHSKIENAFVHRSYINEFRRENTETNERLEFLGDAVLELVITEELMEKYATQPEGVLSKYRSMLVNEKALAQVAKELALGDYIKLGKGEELTQGRDKNSILSDTFEAVVGAVYLSNGLKSANRFLIHSLGKMVGEVQKQGLKQDYKTRLQELAQSLMKTVPKYQIVDQAGPDHQRTFETEVLIGGEVFGKGKGRSKKESEQLAAKVAIEKLKDDDL